MSSTQTPDSKRSDGWLATLALTMRRIRKVARQRFRGKQAPARPKKRPLPKSANKPLATLAGDDYAGTYRAHLSKLQGRLDADVAQQQAVGGSFEAVGQLERALLIQLGLKPNAHVVDVGCGSGRLASQLAGMSELHYLGTDVVPNMLEYARTLCKRSDFQFVVAQGLKIPTADNSADMVCFFSVLTHLRHEDSYRYLAEAKRVLKPGGLIVFSFLEFAIPSHWALFEPMTRRQGAVNVHVDQFIGRDAIQAWADHLELDVVAIHDGDKPHIKFDGSITWDDGRVMQNEGNLGQSVAILSAR